MANPLVIQTSSVKSEIHAAKAFIVTNGAKFTQAQMDMLDHHLTQIALAAITDFNRSIGHLMHEMKSDIKHS